jgi:hypothetical protein
MGKPMAEWWQRLWHRLTCDGWERGEDGRLRLCRSAAHNEGRGDDPSIIPPATASEVRQYDGLDGTGP